jgi:putative transposase
VLNAIVMATQRREHRDGLVISPLTAACNSPPGRLSQRVRDAGIGPSTGAVGSCFDNAMVEAFWARLQVELLNRRRWKTPRSACDRGPRLHRALPQHAAP